MPNLFKDLLSKVSNTFINKDKIVLHENIIIISNYFVKCFNIEIYHKLKENTNYDIKKSNIRSIFSSSVALYLYQSAKEQDKDIKYINTTVSNKPYDPVIDNICFLVREYIKDKEGNKENFDKILFRFMDLLLEYCGLRNGDLYKKNDKEEYNKEQIDKLINILLKKYIRKYKPKRLEFITKAKTVKPKIDPTKISNKKRIELLREEYKFLGKMKYHEIQRNLFCNNNSKLFSEIPNINSKRKLKRTFRQMVNYNSITRKIVDKTHSDLKDKIIKTILPIKKALGIVAEVVKRATELTAKVAKFVGLTNILNAEKERTKVKTKTRERITERTTERSQKPEKTQEQEKPTQTKQEPEKPKEQPKEPQQPVANNDDKQQKQDQQRKQEEEQRKLAEQQKQEQIKQQEELRRKQQEQIRQQQEQRIKDEREIQQRLKEERERFEKQQRELEEQKKNTGKLGKSEGDKLRENGKDDKNEPKVEPKIEDGDKTINKDGRLGDESLDDLLSDETDIAFNLNEYVEAYKRDKNISHTAKEALRRASTSDITPPNHSF